MPDTGHSLEEGDFPGIGSGALLGWVFILLGTVLSAGVDPFAWVKVPSPLIPST